VRVWNLTVELTIANNEIYEVMKRLVKKHKSRQVGFQISTKNTKLVEDHPVNISAKFG
jgi:hypothetical protein